MARWAEFSVDWVQISSFIPLIDEGLGLFVVLMFSLFASSSCLVYAALEKLPTVSDGIEHAFRILIAEAAIRFVLLLKVKVYDGRRLDID